MESLRRRRAAVAAAVVFVVGLLVSLGLTALALTVLGVLALVGLTLVVRGQGSPPVSAARDDDVTVEMAAVGRTVYGRPPLPTRAQIAGALAALRRRIASTAGSRCNALGVALRRSGHAQQAAALHEAARVMFASVGDSRREAFAANGLGAALAEVGEQDAALEQFERARTLLQEVGDRHWEGKVLANIGVAKHRIGQDDEALDLSERALQILTPGTDAYRRVERRRERLPRHAGAADAWPGPYRS